MNKSECILLFKDFVKSELNGDINQLMEFDLTKIKLNEKFGGNDPDNTKIMNAIYVLVWGDKVCDLQYSELSSWDGNTFLDKITS